MSTNKQIISRLPNGLKKRVRLRDWFNGNKASLVDVPRMKGWLLRAMMERGVENVPQDLALSDDELGSFLDARPGMPKDPVLRAAMIEKYRSAAREALARIE